MSFETTAELSLTIDEGDLANVKQQIEDEIGTTAVGVTDGGSMSAQSTGGGSGGGRRARRSMRLAETQTELLEDAVIYLEEIEDKVGGGDGGGGVGGVFTEVLGVAGETAGDAAIEAGDTVADAITDAITGTVASTLGNTISSAIAGSEVDLDTDIARPEWAPLTVQKPEWTVAVEDVPDEVSVEDVGPLPVQRHELPVADIEPLEVEDVGPITVSVETSSASGAQPPSGGGAAPGGGIQLGDENGITIGNGGIQFGGNDGITIGRNPGDPTGTQSPSAAPSAGGREVTVTHSPTYSVDVDPRRLDSLADRIVSEIEEGVNRDIDDLERKLDELEANLGDLERDITQRT